MISVSKQPVGDGKPGPITRAIQKAYFDVTYGRVADHPDACVEKPFDIAFIECGQYDARWESIHMMAEQSARAAVEVGARLMLPIHWGAYALAMHSWYDPVEKVTAEARKAGIAIATPRLGEPVDLGGASPPDDAWWRDPD